MTMDIKRMFDKLNIEPDPLKDQFFLVDEKVIKKIVDFADLRKKDVVLEVGAGTGALTQELAKKAGKVIAFKIDERFKPFLSCLSGNVQVFYESAWKYVQLEGKFKHKKEYNKVVANPPYSFLEPFLHNLTFLEYDKVILLVPLKFVKKIRENDIFGSFFDAKILLRVSKERFYPIPETNPVVIDLIRLPDPIETKNLGLFLRQYIYQHEGQLVKNSLMEGLIKYAKLVYSEKLTKNQARGIIAKIKIPKEMLESHPDRTDVYSLVQEKFEPGVENKLNK